jgi:hypothetical protein
MALQLGGQISLSNITAEMGQINSNVSLTSLSTHSTLNDSSPSKPNETQPHAMSEFFAYDHSYSSLKNLMGSSQVSTRTKWFDVCVEDMKFFYFHDGSGKLPVVGDYIYTDQSGSLTGTAHIKIQGAEDFEKLETVIATVSGGRVESINPCEGLEGPGEPGPSPDEPEDPFRR